ncbi:type II toxin-antitoxin system VapC family toxin [[Mycobacterium] nativiensis]|uniref:Ribonuclease VapC n=1 Tax=[Mycobacterium] nativiensis TaxID=2855503 RepID=A0ABU5Y1B9_9MYCO|nr:type II toxin-antitoxin system VapC family toxin [Mycolicibacter sp. MYC340]MEB3033852.1 type II toxin-antitoxin system VapC family toxin [Mycolicibacter sp. MYC340]
MILLDTNVISALMLQRPDEAVVRWLDDQPAESIWTTSITVFEIWTGLALLEAGRRRRHLEQAFTRLLAEDLEGRVQTFDQPAAVAAAGLAASGRRAGRPVEVRDVQIAGIGVARKASLATRNVRHFQDFGVTLINPWAES